MKQSSVYDIDIYNKIFALPKELKKEVLDFAEFLKSKAVNTSSCFVRWDTRAKF